MSLEKFQKDTDQWTEQFEPQYWPPHEVLAQMTEELWEISREINHLHWVKKKRENVEQIKQNLWQELADLLFAISCMANSHNIDLGQERNKMVEEKRYKRDKDRFKKKV